MNTWQQKNPFLAMLATVDDQEADNAGAGINNPHQQQFSSNLKLPKFWSVAPAILFARAELRFEGTKVLS